MENSEQELVITYKYGKKEFNDRNIHPASLLGIICCFLIPLSGLLLLELVLLIVCLVIGFSDILVFTLILIPSIFGLFYLIFIPSWLIYLDIHWKGVKRLPMDRKWIFTKEGIIIDKTYSKSLHPWITIQHVTISKITIVFGTSPPKKFGFVTNAGEIPVRLITEEQYIALMPILIKYLGESKILLKTDRDKMKFKERNE